MAFASALALLLAPAVTGQAAGAHPASALSRIAGDWQVEQGGKVVVPCTAPQRFVVAPDRRSIKLTQDGQPQFAMAYLVIHDEAQRLLAFVENESRRTRSGDPILWWATFDGPDEFRWRQYDWGPKVKTAGVWKRCR